ncbi:phage tail protein [Acutalibacter intestini]|uniref:phage tail protein n=1 Tax=Acutalibacter intestini TaxID=3093659 RepID=UPI002AC9DB97|nr:phage tail protein [Acutalibacter sp. M00204]
MNTITTIMGDTWDTIAQRAYGGRSQDLTASSLALPRHTQLLMEARENIRLLDYQVFPTGIVVAVPEADDYDGVDGLPDWRK